MRAVYFEMPFSEIDNPCEGYFMPIAVHRRIQLGSAEPSHPEPVTGREGFVMRPEDGGRKLFVVITYFQALLYSDCFEKGRFRIIERETRFVETGILTPGLNEGKLAPAVKNRLKAGERKRLSSASGKRLPGRGKS